MRKTILILIVLLIFGGGFFYVRSVTQKERANGDTVDFKDFFPLNGTGAPGSSFEETLLPSPTENQNSGGVPGSAFTQITNTPVSGFSFFTQERKITIPATTPRGKPTMETVVDRVLRYSASQSGFVYEIKNTESPLQITNLFVPNVYESVFSDNYNTVVHRFLREDGQTIATYAVPIPPENTDGTRTQKAGTFFSDTIDQVLSFSPTTLAYLLPKTTGASVFISTGTDTKRKEVFKSPFQDLILHTANGRLYGQTKAAGTVSGYLYLLDTSRGRFSKILGDIRGLTTSISPKGTYVLYSQSTNEGFSTYLLNTTTGATQPLGLSLLPEKCVWLANEDVICAGNTSVPSGTYPDMWYAGLISFSDQLYRIYTASNTFDVLTETQSFDMTHLQVDETTDTVYFIDKITGYLWKFSF